MGRFKCFLNSLLASAAKHSLGGELIVVDWNSPEDRPSLFQQIGCPASLSGFAVRFIEVPPSVHRRVLNSDRIPFFQMIAKNIGIQRARGEFILATNCDILFSEPMIHLLASPLDSKVIYRTDRLDVPAQVPETLPHEKQLAWCSRNIFRRHAKGRTYLVRQGWKSLPEKILQQSLEFALSSSRFLGGPFRHKQYHVNACGDFTLMPRKVWHELRGYAELPYWSMHLDSLLFYSAIAAGLRQRILKRPFEIYHLDHAGGWAALTALRKYQVFCRMPWIEEGLVKELAKEMMRSGEPLILNGPDWGFGDVSLKEATSSGTSGDSRSLGIPAQT